MDFKQRLIDLMTAKQITAYKMANDIPNITEAMIGKWKKGTSLPSFEKIILLSNYLLTGKESIIVKTNTYSDDEQELVSIYQRLSSRKQGEVIGYIKRMLEENAGELSNFQIG